jgi:hypothetical protein
MNFSLSPMPYDREKERLRGRRRRARKKTAVGASTAISIKRGVSLPVGVSEDCHDRDNIVEVLSLFGLCYSI